MPLAAGTRLGPYEILSPLGAGGMGEVYRARDTRLNRSVAVKILPPTLADDAGRMQRFEREAQMLAALNHPNIAAIYGIELGAIVMELVDGSDLKGPLPLDTALNYAGQIAAGLQAAHEKGIVHRDLKPANIKVTTEGVVKLLDFGLAKAAEETASASAAGASPTFSPTLSMAMTQAGMILGTAAYMSPEQARGKPVDCRADIWAFGVVLYEMLTGASLFEGETVTDVLASVVKEVPDLDRVPATVRRLLQCCLQKDPKQRLQAIGDWRLLLDDTPATASPKPRVSAAVSWAVAGTLAVALIALSFIHFRESPPQPPVLRTTLLPPDGTTLDFRIGTGLPALSPDGRRIAFGARTADGKNPLWMRSLDGLAAQPLAGTDGASFPFWSPDSRFIAFFVDGKLKKMDASGGAAIALADAPRATSRGGSWGRDGVIVFAPRGANSSNPVERVPAAGGASTPLPKAPGRLPWFLPDGKHFLTEVLKGFGGGVEIHVASIDGGESKLVATADTNAVYAQGHLLYVRDGALMAQPFDTRRLATTGEAVPIAEDIQTVLNSGTAEVVSVSENGLLVYRASSDDERQSQLTWFDRNGKVSGTVGGPGVFDTLVLSPDGTRVAVDRLDPQAKGVSTLRQHAGWDIWLVELATGASTRFTTDPANDRVAVWSPDGSRIVFASNRGGDSTRYDLYQKASNGASSEELLLKSTDTKHPEAWSLDGRLLLCSIGDRHGEAYKDHTWLVPMTGDDHKPQPYLVTEFDEFEARLSSDGRWVAYTSNESGKYETYVRPFPDAKGGKWIVSKGGGTQPRWRHDGKELFYISTDSKMMAVDVAPGPSFRSGTPRELFSVPIKGGGASLSYTRYDVAADGGKFLVNANVAAPLGPGNVPPKPPAPLTLMLNWAAGLQK